MPILNDATLEHRLSSGHFDYSATRLDQLAATEYTLATIVCDVSGSTSEFRFEMEECVRQIVRSTKHSPRADSLMLRLVAFDDQVVEIHGFKLLAIINEADYGGVLTGEGSTSLYDAAASSVAATTDYAKALDAEDFTANAILFVITDGEDNTSRMTKPKLAKIIKSARASESLESIITILIGVNVKEASVSQALMSLYKDVGFTQFVELADATEATLARLAAFVARSISAQSTCLGTGSSSSVLIF